VRIQKFKKLIQQHEPLKDGQEVLDITLVQRIRLQKPKVVETINPSPMADALATMLGDTIQPVLVTVKFREKVVRKEKRYFRWMKPDGNGGLIPR